MKYLIVASLLVILIYINPSFSIAQTIVQDEMNKKPMTIRLGAVEEQWDTKSSFELRRRSLELNALLLSPLNIKVGDRIEVHLFDEMIYTVKFTRLFVDLNITFTITGRIEDNEHAYFYLSTKNGVSLGKIEMIEEQKRFSIAYDKNSGNHYLTEIDPSSADSLKCAPPLIPTN